MNPQKQEAVPKLAGSRLPEKLPRGGGGRGGGGAGGGKGGERVGCWAWGRHGPCDLFRLDRFQVSEFLWDFVGFCGEGSGFSFDVWVGVHCFPEEDAGTPEERRTLQGYMASGDIHPKSPTPLN